jgi:hypothetical protein
MENKGKRPAIQQKEVEWTKASRIARGVWINVESCDDSTDRAAIGITVNERQVFERLVDHM